MRKTFIALLILTAFLTLPSSLSAQNVTYTFNVGQSLAFLWDYPTVTSDNLPITQPERFVLTINDPDASVGPCTPTGPCYEVGLPSVGGITYRITLPTLPEGTYTLSIRGANTANGLFPAAHVTLIVADEPEVIFRPGTPTNIRIEPINPN